MIAGTRRWPKLPPAPPRRLPPLGGPGRLTPSRLVATHGLFLILLLFVLFFSLLLPSTYPTWFNWRSILALKSVTAFLALAVMVPLAAGKYDLSVGYALGLTHILCVGLQVRWGWSWELTVFATILVGIAIGLANGLLVSYARIDSFIATLAVGTFVYGLSNWYTGGVEIQGALPQGFGQIAGRTVGPVPIAALYVLVAAVILWAIFEYLPIGRHLYALGANPRAAEMVGIQERRYVIGAFAASGLLTGIGGVIMASQLEVGQASLGPDFLLPAFVGALLGATSVRPGRVNVWGTIIAVLLLAAGIAGLQQEGASFFVEPLFNGGTLAVAVGVAGFAVRRRLAARRAEHRHVDRDRPPAPAAPEPREG